MARRKTLRSKRSRKNQTPRRSLRTKRMKRTKRSKRMRRTKRKRSQNKIGGAVAADPGLAENTWEWERNKKWGKRDADAAAKEEQFRENIRALYMAGIDARPELLQMSSVGAVFTSLDTSDPVGVLSKDELKYGFHVKRQALTGNNLDMLWDISKVAYDTSDGRKYGVDQTSFEKIWSMMTELADRRAEKKAARIMMRQKAEHNRRERHIAAVRKTDPISAARLEAEFKGEAINKELVHLFAGNDDDDGPDDYEKK